ncbi:MAG: sugar ABC transporter permease [Paenibacillaceae bacterium]|nr:sugar ABC transporter permease [Paenibacillaceae bacterium]
MAIDTTWRQSASRERPRIARATKRKLWAYGFILPQLVLFLSFTLYPIAMSYVYAFYDWSGIGGLELFVGWRNFREVASDKLFWNAFRNSFYYMGGTLVVQLPLALLLAIVLNNAAMRGRTFYRTIYFLPVVTITAVVGAVMRNVFANNGGLVNSVVEQLGWAKEPLRFLESPHLVMWVLIGVGSWKWFGIKMVYWLAGLQAIPQSLYEAARLDGTGRWGCFRHVTLPLLLPVGTVITLLSVVDGLHAFDLIKVMTGGGPGFLTEMVDLYIYRYAFGGMAGFPRMGYASAAGILFGMIVFAISLALGWLIRKSNERSA